jgi:ribosomal protein L11 methyltransferase
MEVYYALKVESTDEILMAVLMQFDFESIEENETSFTAYIKKSFLDAALKVEIEAILTQYAVSYAFEDIEPQNWNALWEASFQPVIVGTFCQVRADFHPPKSGVQHDIIINPKMAFGTGHHATTHMMIAQMEHVDFVNKTVFDFGCGTGILAILASKLGAETVDALDIEHESYNNTIENSTINNVPNIIAYEGDLDATHLRIYDIILANINRNILIRYSVDLSERLISGGTILLSGVLTDDRNIVIQSFEALGFIADSVIQKDGWICATLTKK